MELNLFLLILFLLSHFSSALLSSSMGPLCNEHDQVALLQFKHSLSLDQTNCPNPNPHLLSWAVHNETNNTAGCCSWEGVTCEAISGRVIGLDLSYGCLRGAIDSANPIFQIFQLQQLNLSGNDFAQSQIPSAFGKFSMLNSLNLAHASFSGLIPWEILELSSLTSLDLSGNPSLHLPSHGLASIARNMKDLTELSLGQINISSDVPKTFANLTSLRMLHLEDCYLQDNFPVEIFLLPKLESLNLINNPDLYGYLPEFPMGRSSLRSLDVSKCNFSRQIPSTIGNLVNITKLHLSFNQFSGSIPSSLGNLTSLIRISLAYNPFSPSNLSWIGKLTKLKELYLAGTNLYGTIPFSLTKLEQIERLHLSYNNLRGQIPSWIGNFTRLERLGLAGNNLDGQIPSSIFSLKNLEYLHLLSNKLSGTVDISLFHEQKNISRLQLSFNNLSVVSNKFINFSLPHLELLALDSCHLSEIPLFLKNQGGLKILSLGANKISGEIPAWVFNISKETMLLFNLSYNNLTGFELPMVVLPWSKLKVLDLSFNNIHGSLPLPSLSISFYSLSNNSLSGELSPTFCKAKPLSVLDLSDNELSGAIPECLGNLSSSLQILNLRGNMFKGMIPEIHIGKCRLQWINLSQNQLIGKLPKTLAKCKGLQRLDVGKNQITDTFPSWLGTLPNLQVVILKTNNFHGPMGSPSSMVDFPKLRIIDLSNNAFTGALPSEYFPLWKGMMFSTKEPLSYLQVTLNWNWYFANANWTCYYNYSMSTKLMNKGMDREYEQVPNSMVFLSLSENKFAGEIPESIGHLVGLDGLDLSNNNLTGSIPPALGELKNLESLDLSLNMLSGEIPQQLSQLTFLGYLNLSYNNLSGKIPEGGQLGTFGNSSFVGNPGLYGLSLSNRRGSANEPTAASEGQDPGSSDHTKLVLGFEGFATGLAVGLGIGYIITTRNHEWFVKACLKLRYRKQ